MKTQKLLFAVIIAIFSTNAFAQDTNVGEHTVSIGISEVALLDLESNSGNNITLNATAPEEAGEKVTFEDTNADLWINYSSIVGTEQTRDVTVQITGGDVPAGIELSVKAANDAGKGDGAMGIAVTNSIVLNDKNATSIIAGVGSAYTGDGAENGHNLTYAIKQSSDEGAYASLNLDDSTTISITYTLTDN